MNIRTMGDVKRLNSNAGFHFFDVESMRFFDSRIESMLLRGRYFVTSERFDVDSPRLYSIRRFQPDASILTVGAFQAYSSRTEAMAQVFLLEDTNAQ